MSDLTRRKLIKTGLAAAVGASGLGVAARLRKSTDSCRPITAASTASAKR